MNLHELAVYAKLRALGGTRDEVADSLRAAGIAGEPGHGDVCPIANYLLREFPELRTARLVASHYNVSWHDRRGCWGEVQTPEPVRAFMVAFDDWGVYADLVTPVLVGAR
jgi:hypothetical protein